MTVKAWFRIQRRELWARDARLAVDLERLVTKVINQELPDLCEALHPHVLLFDVDTWVRSHNVLERVRQQMNEYIRVYEREMQRRAAIGDDILQ